MGFSEFSTDGRSQSRAVCQPSLSLMGRLSTDEAVSTTLWFDRAAVRSRGSGSRGAGIEFNCVSVCGIGSKSGPVAGFCVSRSKVCGAEVAGALSLAAGVGVCDVGAAQEEQPEVVAP